MMTTRSPNLTHPFFASLTTLTLLLTKPIQNPILKDIVYLSHFQKARITTLPLQVFSISKNECSLMSVMNLGYPRNKTDEEWESLFIGLINLIEDVVCYLSQWQALGHQSHRFMRKGLFGWHDPYLYHLGEKESQRWTIRWYNGGKTLRSSCSHLCKGFPDVQISSSGFLVLIWHLWKFCYQIYQSFIRLFIRDSMSSSRDL